MAEKVVLLCRNNKHLYSVGSLFDSLCKYTVQCEEGKSLRLRLYSSYIVNEQGKKKGKVFVVVVEKERKKRSQRKI